VLDINVELEVKGLTKHLNDIQKKQIPFATKRTLDKLAWRVKKEEQKEMRRIFDRPTPFTLNSLYTKNAKKTHLVSYVWLKADALKGTPAINYLGPHIFNGPRRQKGVEKLLTARGILPRGNYVVPGKRARLDKYGNISKGQLNQILSYSGAQRDRAQNTKRGRRGTKARFIVLKKKGSLPGGIWSIHPGNLTRPVLIFVRKVWYKRLKWDYFGVANRTIGKHFKPEFEKAFDEAMRTAK